MKEKGGWLNVYLHKMRHTDVDSWTFLPITNLDVDKQPVHILLMCDYTPKKYKNWSYDVIWVTEYG